MTIGGLLLAGLSIAAASGIDPAEHGIAGTLRVWAIGTLVAGLVLALMGVLPTAPAWTGATPRRPRLRGLLLAGTAALVVMLKVAVDRESSWLTVLGGTVLLMVGIADFGAERRRVRTAAGEDGVRAGPTPRSRGPWAARGRGRRAPRR